MGKKTRRRRKLTRHHLTPKSRGGNGSAKNILYIHRNKHDVWHILFGNATLEEAALLLFRIAKMKGRENEYIY